jgi:hypothetical protein
MPLRSSGSVDWATDPVAGPSVERADVSHPIISQPALVARDLGDRALHQPSNDPPLATLEAVATALHRVIAELMTPAGAVDSKRAQLCAELEFALEALTAVAEQNQSALEHSAELEALVDRVREEAENRERSLMEQQDGVLEALLTEHERQTQALEHELERQSHYAASLRRELVDQNELVGSLREQQEAFPRRAPTPRTWPPNDAADEPPDASKSHPLAPERANVARLVADRDHLLASLRLLKRQRDDAQQETLDLVEQLAAANNEIEALRAQLPSVSAPPVPSSRRAETPETEVPPAPPVFACEQPGRARVSDSAPAVPVPRPSKAPTLPPDRAPTATEDYWAQDSRAGAMPAHLRGTLSRNEPERAPPLAAPFRTMTRPGPAGCFEGSERIPVAATDASGLPPSRRDAPRPPEVGAPLSDRKPPLKRKPDPTQRPLGSYSVTGAAETESFRPSSRETGRPSGGRRT